MRALVARRGSSREVGNIILMNIAFNAFKLHLPGREQRLKVGNVFMPHTRSASAAALTLSPVLPLSRD